MLIRRNDDELISAYVDGQLSGRERQAFEARIAADPSLHRRVEATRQLVQAARALPAVPAPRNFTLPKSMGAPASTARPGPGPVWWRLGSAVAMAVFVFAVVLDVSGVLAPPAPQPTLNAAPLRDRSMPTEQSTSNQAVEAPQTTATPQVGSRSATDGSAEMPAGGAGQPPAPAGTPTPQGTPATKLQAATVVTPSDEITALSVAQETPTAPEIAAREIATESVAITEAYGGAIVDATPAPQTETLAASVADETATPAPAATAMADTASANQADTATAQTEGAQTQVEPPAPVPAPIEPGIPWARVVAVVALVLAVGMAILGRRR